jgi:diguanylate cyclase (GGDEF)-like protein
MVLRRKFEGWEVTHLVDDHYGFEVGDLFDDPDDGDFILDEGAVELHPMSITLNVLRGELCVKIEPVKGHIFHRIVTQQGDTFGAIVGLSSGKLAAAAIRSIPIISLLSELVMQTHLVCSSYISMSKKQQQSEIDACRDELTQVLNLRGWKRHVNREVSRAKRSCHPLFVVMVDIDNFKRFNDNYGHAFGDEILKSVANTLKINLREGDIIARVGGDEFAVLASDTEEDGATGIIDNLNRALKDKKIPCSFGAEKLSVDKGLDWCTSEADKKMYQIKHGKKQ